MKEENVIEIVDIHKRFKVYFDKSTSLKDKILFKNRNKYEERWVLKGISFNVKKGEALGLIGKNGCGKSTTLKLLSRIMYPDKGTIKIQGRVSSLIELGAGFHQDMSGRENIYTNASIFGLTRKEIDERVNDIIAFSELEEFIENPVRTYSSGMYMRLAFSVAISVNAEVLLIDEILGVGDVSFQTKCFEKLKEIKAQGTTIVIVSHSLGQIEQICDRTIWIEDGLIKEEGVPKFIHEHYLFTMEEKRLEKLNLNNNTSNENILKYFNNKLVRLGNQFVEITDFILYDKDKNQNIIFKTEDFLEINIGYKSNTNNLSGYVCINISRDDGVLCYGTNSKKDNNDLVLFKDYGKIEITFKKINLLPGKYTIDVMLKGEDNEVYDDIRNIYEFQVKSDTKDKGVMKIEHNWQFK